jgi:hypothetical protein
MQLPLIVRAIITGFGYKVGTEIAKYVVDRVAERKKKKAAAAEAEAAEEEGLPDGLPTDPPEAEAPARRTG